MYDIEQILELLPHRYPFVMLDRILAVESGIKIHGIKNLSYQEPCFQGHIPQKPIFPGVYMIEALAQIAGILLMLSEPINKDKMFVLAKVEKAKFKKFLIPGDQLQLHAEFIRSKQGLYHFKGHIEVDNKIAMQAEFWLAEG